MIASDAMKLIVEPGQVTELRALNVPNGSSGWKQTHSGYYNDADALARDADRLQEMGATGIYFIPNVIDPALLSRSVNRCRAVKAEPTTADHDIARRRWMLIDCDPIRASGISSSDDEHDAAMQKARDVYTYLQARGWSEPIVADSSNGFHLLYRIDLDAEDDGLVQRCLEALAKRFDDDAVTIDRKVFNAARIVKLYGTITRKGDSTEDRPHRQSKIVKAPEVVEVVPRDLLEALAGPKPNKTSRRATLTGRGHFNLAQWIAEHSLDVREPKPWKAGGTRWEFRVCPFATDHTDGSAFIAQQPTGEIAASCHHNSCSWTWRDLREKYEPQRSGRLKVSSNGHAQVINGQPTQSRLDVVRVADVKRRAIEWLWFRRFAEGSLGIIGGYPGLAKSLVTIDMMARITTGRAWPDLPDSPIRSGSCILLALEDGLDDVIAPRLDAAGADTEKVLAVRGVEEFDGSGQRTFNINRDTLLLDDLIKERNDCRLIVVDPISDYLPRDVDTYRDNEVRQALQPLIGLAERRQLAVVGVMHLNKGQNQNALYKLLGSVAFGAIARNVWFVAEDPEDNDEGRLFVRSKMNAAKAASGLRFRVVSSETVMTDTSTPPGLVQWLGTTEMTANDAMAPACDHPDETRTKVDEAAEWLETLLTSKGPQRAKDLKRWARENCIAERTLDRAKSRLKVAAKPEVIGAAWFWHLPSQLEEVEP